MKNLAGGSGCGCGCLGLLVMLIGAVALVGIPLEVYDEAAASSAILVAVASLGSGLLVAVVGGVVWIISWFLE
jgi:hypothetical protein